jgi:hypothetical protein
VITPLLKPSKSPKTGFKLRNGREICTDDQAGRREYRRRRELAWDRDRGICILCEQPVSLEQATTEHIQTKGMGGSKHDDRLENLAVSHWFGNNARGSMSLAKYLSKPLEERIRLCS